MDLYDLVPYVSEPYPESHPDLLAAIAAGFGLKPPPVDTASILELGSSSGNNLIPIAAFIPGSRCLGIDGSAPAVSSGKSRISALGLTNIELRPSRFEQLISPGQFDYVLCHGVYSWISPEIRRGVLKIIGESLAPGGLAYVSFNTYPGWHQRMPVRDLMRYYLNQAENIGDPRQQIAEGRLIAAATADQIDRRDLIYRQTMSHAASQFASMPDWYLFHDYLETENHPVYFHEFVAEAREAGLAFLADVVDNEISIPEFRQELERIDKLTGAASPRPREQQEQFYDFSVNRAFRRAILVRSADSSAIQREQAGRLERKVRYASKAGPTPAVPALVRLQAAEGKEITNYLHESIELSGFAAEVVKRLDGETTLQKIADELNLIGLGVAYDPLKTFREVQETVDLLLSMGVIAD